MENKYNKSRDTDFFFNTLSLEHRLRFMFCNTFAECLVRRRSELGWTQDRLAEESGVNRVTIAKIETFQRPASIDIMLKLLYALGLQIQFVEADE